MSVQGDRPLEGPASHIVYISIGNSDDKLSQRRWAEFVSQVDRAAGLIGRFHGRWVSRSDDAFQNACWCVELPVEPEWASELRDSLAALATSFGQDSIAWAEVLRTDFLSLATLDENADLRNAEAAS